MYTTTRDAILPTTVTGSWPRPRWMSENLSGELFSGKLSDVRFREQFVDGVTTIISDQEMAGLDILTNGDYHQDDTLGGGSWTIYPLERLGGVSSEHPQRSWMTSPAHPPGTILHEVMSGVVYPTVVDAITDGVPLEYDKIWRIAQARSVRPVKFGTASAQSIAMAAPLRTERYAKDKRQLIWDIATVQNAELRKLAEAGCKAIQIEEPLIHMVAATANDKDFLDFLVEAFNHEVAGLDDVEIWIHTCWGNPAMQRIQDAVSYENSLELYLDRLHGDVWTVEWKNNGQQTLKLLEKYRDNLPKKVALGLIDHRTLQVESAQEVAADIRTILESVDPRNVVLSSNCGFGHQGANRLITNYKAASLAQGANIVREELGYPTTPVRSASPQLQIDV
ncbi:cobalamin-independent methionine synthase II family protein [Streptomyces sp. NPDC007084]|uniref:cobalamin-independent methionine synthase II family protein n=1 Tax=Streptomyces sp. NPDC007084 TaxID=3154313 RepID=UPI00345647A2